MVLGEHDDQTDPDCEEDYCAEKIQTISVSEVYVHSLYDSSSQDYDISIIKLEEEAQLSGILSRVTRNDTKLLEFALF